MGVWEVMWGSVEVYEVMWWEFRSVGGDVTDVK